MYNTIKRVVISRNYELTDILAKIDKRCIEGKITEEQRDELVEMARGNANPQNSYAPFQEQIEKLANEVKLLREEVEVLKNGGTIEVTPKEEYPEYVQPTGSHDAYKIGDKITYDGKKYECVVDGCVWNPDGYPQGWREVTE